MESLRGKIAVVVGASSGIGRATVNALRSEGASVSAIARGREALDALHAAAPGVRVHRADAADPATAAGVLRDLRPDLVVLAAGARPKMAPLEEQTWESFAEPWNVDAQAAFHWVKGALTMPLKAGSTVVVVSSGSAINGSPLSGGYAGAKRMQWLLARYAQQRADQRQLGIRFLAVLPNQLVQGTVIGTNASEAYGVAQGITGAEFMARFAAPLDAARVADAILAGLRGDVADGVTAIRVTGDAVEPIG